MPPSRSGSLDLYRALWHYAEGRRLQIFGSMLLLVGSTAIKLSIPWLAAQALDRLQVQGVNGLADAGMFVALIFGANAASWALHGPGRILERNVAIRVRESLADTLATRLMSLPLSWHEQHHSGETIHRMNRSTDALYDFAQSQFIYLQNVVNLIGPLAALLLLSPGTGAAAIVGYLVIMVSVMGFDRRMVVLAHDENAAERRLQAAQVDALGNIVSVLALRLQTFNRALLSSRLAGVFAPLRRMIVLNEAKWCSVDLLNAALWCALVALYVWLAHLDAQASGAPLLIGGIFMVHQYTQQAGGVVVAIASQYQSYARHRADFASATPILEAAADALVAAPSDAQRHAPSPSWQRLELTGLNFVHPRARGGQRTLDEVALAFERGRRIALIGESGSGKSSLLRVLAGLYAAESGELRVDGQPMLALREGLAERATLIPQDAEMFEATLEDNLRMGDGSAPALLDALVRVACLDTLVASFPQGLATPISERGGNLSGGQRQRVALARGLLFARDSGLLLLDEVTSSLDPATESAVFERLFEARRDACIVASIHRLHLLPLFDEVVLMAQGRVADRGAPAEIAARHPAIRAQVERRAD